MIVSLFIILWCLLVESCDFSDDLPCFIARIIKVKTPIKPLIMNLPAFGVARISEIMSEIMMPEVSKTNVIRSPDQFLIESEKF